MGVILGFDHICGSCRDINVCVEELAPLAYTPLFVERDLPIAPGKLPFLRSNDRMHDVAFLMRQSAVSVEMIDHGSDNESTHGRYHVVLVSARERPEVIEREVEPVREAIENALGCQVVLRSLPSVGTPYYEAIGLRRTSGRNGLVVLECSDIGKLIGFWESVLGLECVARSEARKARWQLMEFRSPVASWNVQVLLVQTEDRRRETACLDNWGWTCVSVLVADIERAMREAAAFSAQTLGEPYATTINNKELRLCFLRGCDGELIEFIQLVK